MLLNGEDLQASGGERDLKLVAAPVREPSTDTHVVIRADAAGAPALACIHNSMRPSGRRTRPTSSRARRNRGRGRCWNEKLPKAPLALPLSIGNDSMSAATRGAEPGERSTRANMPSEASRPMTGSPSEDSAAPGPHPRSRISPSPTDFRNALATCAALLVDGSPCGWLATARRPRHTTRSFGDALDRAYAAQSLVAWPVPGPTSTGARADGRISNRTSNNAAGYEGRLPS